MKRSRTLDRRYSGANRTTRIPRKRAVIRPVVKYFDTSGIHEAQSNNVNWSGSAVPCDFRIDRAGALVSYTEQALIPSSVGNGYGQINGNSYIIKKLHVRGNLTQIGDSDEVEIPAPRTFRLLLVKDRMPSGVQANPLIIMSEANFASVFSFKAMFDQGARFEILKDLTSEISPHVTAQDGITTDPVSPNTFAIGWTSAQFDFEWIPHSSDRVQIMSSTDDPLIENLVNCNVFLLLQTIGKTMVISFASRCYYCD